MSVVTIQIGQYGNQVGHEFFSTLTKELFSENKTFGRNCNDNKSINNENKTAQNRKINPNRLLNDSFEGDSLDIFFQSGAKNRNNYVARCILIDTEAKVVNRVLSSSSLLSSSSTLSDKLNKTWSYNKKFKISHKYGSGNNWAQGFYSFGAKVVDSFDELIRHQVEKCDRLGGFLTLMSLAGGTGSGLGSYLIRHLREYYDKSVIVSQVIWPYRSGEIAVQSYNSILSLAHIYDSVDSIIAFDNDKLHKTCLQQLGLAKVSLSDINSLIAMNLVYAFLPSFTDDFNGSFDCLGDYVNQLTPHPDFKMTSLMTSPMIGDLIRPFTVFSWSCILKELGRLYNLQATPSNEFDPEWQLKFDGTLNNNRAFAHILINRGFDCSLKNNNNNNNNNKYNSNQNNNNNDVTIKNEFLKLKSTYPIYQPNGFLFKHHQRPVFNQHMSSLLAYNDVSQMSIVDEALDKACKLFENKAYVHQYERYGCTDDDFVDSFLMVQQLLSNYAKL